MEGDLDLESLKCFVDQCLEFLTPYLALANAHASEFITEEHWERLIPGNIKQELMACTIEDLKRLPLSGYSEACGAEGQDTHSFSQVLNSSMQLMTENDVSSLNIVADSVKNSKMCRLVIETKFKHQENQAVHKLCEEIAKNFKVNEESIWADEPNEREEIKFKNSEASFHMKDAKSIKCLDEYYKSDSESNSNPVPRLNYNPVSGKMENCFHCKSLKQLKHNNLRDFCKNAWMNTIEGQGLAVGVKEMIDKLCTAENDSGVFVPAYMNQKKSHEVDIMTEVCAHLSRFTQCKLVVDIGSGKGYLGQTLYLQKKMRVLGIDAVTSNTIGAERRLGIVGKQWVGLNRNLENQLNKSRLTKKQKKLLKFKANESLNGTENSTEKFQMELNGAKSDSDFRTGIIQSKNIVCKKGSFKHGCYVPLTMFVNTYTDLKKLAMDIFTSEKMPHANETESVKNTMVNDNENNLCVGVGDSEHVADEISGCSKLSYCSVAQDTNTDACSNEQTEISKNDLDIMLVGLHTCGDLASSIPKLFVSNPNVKCLCYVGCCYHLLTEEFLEETPQEVGLSEKGQFGFPLSSYLKEKRVCLGNTARNLASQSIYRMVESEELQGNRFYARALLQKLIIDLADPESVQWVGLRRLEQKSTGILDYIKKAWKKLKLSEDLVTAEIIQTYIERYKLKQKQLAAFFQLKAVLAPCIESLILLDRMCFLKEQKNVKDVYLVKMFDLIISPRCYGIVATKC